MRQAIVDQLTGLVINLAIGDAGGVEIPANSPVTMGWKYANEQFSPPTQPPKTATQMVSEIESAYTQAINIIAAKSPPTERDSWPKQESEARAYLADNTAPTPLLSAIAAARGMPVAAMAARVVQKADAYAVLAGEAIGRRGARMDAIAAAVAANDQTALEAIVW